MDKRERVLACMNHLTVDRPPVGFWFHFAENQKMGEACVQAHLNYYNHVDVDLVKIMCDGYFDYPNPLAQSVQKASDWYHLKPLGKNHPFLREQVERAKAVKDGLKDDMCVFYNVFAPFSSIRYGTSDEMVMAHLREDPQAIAYALDMDTIASIAYGTLSTPAKSHFASDFPFYTEHEGYTYDAEKAKHHRDQTGQQSQAQRDADPVGDHILHGAQ